MLNAVKVCVLITLCWVILFSCAGSKKTAGENELIVKPAMDESFDTMDLKEDKLDFNKPEKVKSKPSHEKQPIKGNENVSGTPIENRLINGFRIQIVSTKNLESANNTLDIAGEQFEDLQLRAYLEFDSPNYKVRLGDFASRADAQEARRIVRSRGYSQAWTVPSKVWSNPELFFQSDSLNQESEQNINN